MGPGVFKNKLQGEFCKNAGRVQAPFTKKTYRFQYVVRFAPAQISRETIFLEQGEAAARLAAALPPGSRGLVYHRYRALNEALP
jgi:hypothetical protein